MTRRAPGPLRVVRRNPRNPRLGEYVALIEAADMVGHHGVAVLLETCLADKLAFAERTRRLMRRVVEARVVEKVAAAAR